MPCPTKYKVVLDHAQRQALEARRSDPLTLRQRNRVDDLREAHAGETDSEIAEGLDAAPAERPRKGAPPRLDGKQEAAVIALACRPTGDGQARWSVRRLAGRAVELEVVESLSRETVRRLLKKTR